MVTHDYERGMITGLPRSVVDEVRRTGKLPRGAIHPSMVDVWDALAEQRRHQLPPGMTVADIQRQRDGWDEAFDPEVWERLSGGGELGDVASRRTRAVRAGAKAEADGLVGSGGVRSLPFSDYFAAANCRDMALRGPLATPSGVQLDTPPGAEDGPCTGDAVWVYATPWQTYPERWASCERPLVDVEWGYEGCRGDASEYLQVVAEPCSRVRWFDLLAGRMESSELGGACSADMLELIAHGLCVLTENPDLLTWALCLAYGPAEGALLAGRLRDQVRDAPITCCEGRSGVFGNSTGTYISLNEDLLARWVDRYATGSQAARLCAIIHMAILLFHELMHNVLGLYGVDVDGTSEACHPMWLSETAVKYSLLQRFPRARESKCCDGCLDDVFWRLPLSRETSACAKSAAIG